MRCPSGLPCKDCDSPSEYRKMTMKKKRQVKIKKHFAPAATGQEILDGVGIISDKVTVVGDVTKKDKERVKKLLAELEKANPFTPERIKEIQEETRKRLDKEEEERRKPPKTPVGTCGVCNGDVKAEYVHGLRAGVDSRSVPIGPGGAGYYGWQFKGYHCVECGLVYKFAPGPYRVSD